MLYINYSFFNALSFLLQQNHGYNYVCDEDVRMLRIFFVLPANLATCTRCI